MRILWHFIRRKIRRDFPGVPAISTSKLAELLDENSGSSPMLVDVRKKEEFDVSHLPNAIHVANTDALLRLLETENTQDSDKMIVLYCSVGYRSARVTEELLAAGVENAVNLDGSIFQWFNEGRSVYRSEKLVGDVHPFSKFWSLLLKRKRDI